MPMPQTESLTWYNGEMTAIPDHPRSALTGIDVLDMTTGMAGALATMFLCDNGANVIRIVQDAGHVLRAEPGYALWDRGKKAVTIDDAVQEDAFARLAAIDVVVDDLPPGSEGKASTLLGRLRSANQQLIHCSITAYGTKGPLAGEPAEQDLVMARTGMLSGQPGFRDGPVHVVHPVASLGAGLLAALGITAALLQRERTGIGARVDTSLMAGALLYVTGATWDRLKPGPSRATPAGGSPFYSVFECADGEWVQLGCIHAGFADRAASALGIAHLMPQPESSDGRVPRPEEEGLRLFDLVAEAMRTRPAAEWAHLFEEADVPFAQVGTTDEAMDEPQIRHNMMVSQLNDPLLGQTFLAGLPIGLSLTPGLVGRPRAARATSVGEALPEDRRPAVTAPLGRPRSGTREPDASGLPLEGTSVLEAANALAGPLAGRLLADLGADVVKLESPNGDIFRPGGGPLFVYANANKRSISVNTRTSEGREVAQRLASGSDVLLANMRPGATDRMGLGSDTLAQLNPRLIETHTTAFGWSGPYSHRPGVDPLAQALTGLQRIQGGVDRPPVYLSRLAPCDFTAGTLGALGAVLALVARERYGIAQRVDTNLLNAGVLISADSFMRAPGKPPRRLADHSHYGLDALHRLYQVVDGWLYLAADSDEHWRSLCSALGLAHLRDDHRFDTNQLRIDHDHELSAELAATFGGRPLAEVLDSLGRDGVPSAPVVKYYSQAFFSDPQARENDLVAEVEHPNLGRVSLATNLVKLSGRAPGAMRPTPLLGEHTREVLADLGYTAPAIQALYDKGVAKTESPS